MKKPEHVPDAVHAVDEDYKKAVQAKLADIKANPDNHRHTYDELTACCSVDGVLDSMLQDAHSSFAAVGINGGISCDVTSGPCSCGAWH